MEKIKQLQKQKEELQRTIESIGQSSDGGSVDRDVASPAISPRSDAVPGAGAKVGTLDFGKESANGS